MLPIEEIWRRPVRWGVSVCGCRSLVSSSPSCWSLSSSSSGLSIGALLFQQSQTRTTGIVTETGTGNNGTDGSPIIGTVNGGTHRSPKTGTVHKGIGGSSETELLCPLFIVKKPLNLWCQRGSSVADQFILSSYTGARTTWPRFAEVPCLNQYSWNLCILMRMIPKLVPTHCNDMLP